MTTQTHRPATPEVLYGAGAFQFNVAEFPGATPRLAPCWHSALPEIWHTTHPELRNNIAHLMVPYTAHDDLGPWETTTCVPVTRRVLAALLLSLLLPLAARATEPCKVNVNTAPPAQLALLIRTGPALAAKIEAARKDPETGAAVVLDAAKLDAVSGIGTKWLEYNAPHVAYSGETTCVEKLRKPPATGETESDTVRKEASGGGR